MTMQNDSGTQWQVTCDCGWRTHGTREALVRAVQEHGRTAHQLDVTPDQAMALATPYQGS